MPYCSVPVMCFMLIAAIQSTAFAYEPASPPKQFLLQVSVLEGRPCNNDGSPEHVAAAIRDARQKNQMRSLAEPNLIFLENRECHFSAGGELAGVKKVKYGIALDVLARSNRDGTIELDFVAEQSRHGQSRASDLGGDVTRISAEKLCGKLRMRPGVVYRVSGEKHDNGETLWEFQIEPVSKKPG